MTNTIHQLSNLPKNSELNVEFNKQKCGRFLGYTLIAVSIATGIIAITSAIAFSVLAGAGLALAASTLIAIKITAIIAGISAIILAIASAVLIKLTHAKKVTLDTNAESLTPVKQAVKPREELFSPLSKKPVIAVSLPTPEQPRTPVKAFTPNYNEGFVRFRSPSKTNNLTPESKSPYKGPDEGSLAYEAAKKGRNFQIKIHGPNRSKAEQEKELKTLEAQAESIKEELEPIEDRVIKRGQKITALKKEKITLKLNESPTKKLNELEQQLIELEQEKKQDLVFQTAKSQELDDLEAQISILKRKLNEGIS